MDRIASTTQYNGVNVLDGSYGNKVFQIGVCWTNDEYFDRKYVIASTWVATSNSASVASSSTIVPSTTTTVTSGGATAKGTEAIQTVVNLGSK